MIRTAFHLSTSLVAVSFLPSFKPTSRSSTSLPLPNHSFRRPSPPLSGRSPLSIPGPLCLQSLQPPPPLFRLLAPHISSADLTPLLSLLGSVLQLPKD